MALHTDDIAKALEKRDRELVERLAKFMVLMKWVYAESDSLHVAEQILLRPDVQKGE